MNDLVSGQGVVTTIAGTDFQFPDGVAAGAAPLAGLRSVSLDPRGGFIVASDLHQVLRVTPDGVVQVVAGTGIPGFSGDGGFAKGASLRNPFDAVADSDGNVYIADRTNNRIRRVSPDGIITTIAGTGLGGARPTVPTPALQASLQPSSIALDASGNLYTNTTGTNRVYKLDRSGMITVFAGNGLVGPPVEGPAASSPLDATVNGVAVDGEGNVYIAVGNRIVRVDPQGMLKIVVAQAPSQPLRIAVDGSGTVYYTGFQPERVFRVDRAGNVTPFGCTGDQGFSGDGGTAIAATCRQPDGIASDAAGNVYFADRNNDRVRRVTAGGLISTVAGRGRFLGDGGQAAIARLFTPIGLVLDRSGNLIAADGDNNLIRRVTPAGVITTIAGTGGAVSTGSGGQAVQAGVPVPVALAIDGENRIYVAERIANKVRRLEANGTIQEFAGRGASGSAGDGGPAAAATLNQPMALAVDGAGNVYIRETAARVRRVSPTGTITTFAGTGTAGYSGDGGPAAAAQIGNVGGLCTDGSGNLYITDANRVRRVSADGTISTFAGTGVAETSGDGGAASSAGVQQPLECTFDPQGNFYVVAFNKIRKIAANGTISSISTNRSGLSGDGGLLQNATFGSARGLAADAKGNLYIAESQFSRIRLAQAGAGPSLLLSQRGLTFASVAGVAPASQTFTIVNGGAGTLNWTLAVSTTSGGNWLTVPAASGTAESGRAGATVEVRVNASGLAPGDYYGLIEARAPGAPNSPQAITVVLNVLAAGTAPRGAVQPIGLIFTAPPGAANPAAQSITVTTQSAANVAYTAAAQFPEGRAWFAIAPASGTVSAAQAARLELRPSIAGFGEGVYSGVVTVAFADGATRRVDVLLVISAGAGLPAGRAVGRAADGCAATRLLPLFTQLGTDFRAAVAFPAPLELKVVDSCGQPVADGEVTVTFSNGDAPVSLNSLRDGRWSATWTPRNAASGVTLTARARAGTPEISGSATAQAGVAANDNPPPEIAAGGVLNAASYQLRGPLAPGSLVAVFGQRLSEGIATAQALPLDTVMSGTRVTIAGRALPLVFTSPGQVNAMLPYDVAIQATHQLILRRGAAISVPEPVSLLTAQAGVFTQQLTGKGAAIVVGVQADGTQFLVTAATPLQAGDFVVIYCTGLGEVDPRVPAGSPAPADPPAQTLTPVTVTIGGLEAPVFFAGLTPGFTGLYQINAKVPEGLPPGDEVELVVSQAGVASPAVGVAVK